MTSNYKEYEYDEVEKCVLLLWERVMRAERKLSLIPKQSHYQSGSDFFFYLEKRNEALNEIIKILGEKGFQHPYLRIHQIDGDRAMKAIANFVTVLQNQENIVKSQ